VTYAGILHRRASIGAIGVAAPPASPGQFPVAVRERHGPMVIHNAWSAVLKENPDNAIW
jgi:hypothetical protein